MPIISDIIYDHDQDYYDNDNNNVWYIPKKVKAIKKVNKGIKACEDYIANSAYTHQKRLFG